MAWTLGPSWWAFIWLSRSSDQRAQGKIYMDHCIIRFISRSIIVKWIVESFIGIKDIKSDNTNFGLPFSRCCRISELVYSSLNDASIEIFGNGKGEKFFSLFKRFMPSHWKILQLATIRHGIEKKNAKCRSIAHFLPLFAKYVSAAADWRHLHFVNNLLN